MHPNNSRVTRQFSESTQAATCLSTHFLSAKATYKCTRKSSGNKNETSLCKRSHSHSRWKKMPPCKKDYADHSFVLRKPKRSLQKCVRKQNFSTLVHKHSVIRLVSNKLINQSQEVRCSTFPFLSQHSNSQRKKSLGLFMLSSFRSDSQHS